MNRHDELMLRHTLIKAIERWWEEEAAKHSALLPIVGDATHVFMAEAALGVLLSIADVETYLRSNGFMKEESE